jgi:hypothetical protein
MSSTDLPPQRTLLHCGRRKGRSGRTSDSCSRNYWGSSSSALGAVVRGFGRLPDSSADDHHPATAEAIIRWAAIATMTQRIARGTPATRPGPRHFTTAL